MHDSIFNRHENSRSAETRKDLSKVSEGSKSQALIHPLEPDDTKHLCHGPSGHLVADYCCRNKHGSQGNLAEAVSKLRSDRLVSTMSFVGWRRTLNNCVFERIVGELLPVSLVTAYENVKAHLFALFARSGNVWTRCTPPFNEPCSAQTSFTIFFRVR